MEAGAAWFVFSYCQVYKYRRFRTVRQNTSGWRVVAGGGKGLGRLPGVCVCAVVGGEKFRERSKRGRKMR